jgi:hypothetical protein
MDTVCVAVQGNLSPDILASFEDHLFCKSNDWDIRARVEPDHHGEIRNSFTAVHKKPHLFIQGVDGYLRKATFHLPEIVHGFNGLQIKNQYDLDDALSIARELISEITERTVTFGIVHRLDFAYNLPCKPAEWIGALRTIKHPAIRSIPKVYQSNGIQWHGCKLTLSGYLKTHCGKRRDFPKNKQINCDDNHLRIEVQAQSKQRVAQVFNDNEILMAKDLSIEKLYAKYRAFLAQLPVAAKAPKKITLDLLLALLSRRNEVLPNGLTVFDAWASTNKPDTINRMRKKMNAALQGLSGMPPLVEMLPVEFPFNFLDVMPDRSTREVIMVDERKIKPLPDIYWKVSPQ